MATEVQDLGTFWQNNKYLTKEGFIKTHPYPFLVEIDPKPLNTDSRVFETIASRSREDREQFRSQTKIESASRVLRVSKRSPDAFGGKISVGRSPNNDIVLPHMSVSKFHAYFTVSDVRFEYTLFDANSSNGTILNGLPLTPLQAAEVRNGDRISFGGELLFFFLMAQDLFSRITIMQKFL
jgi:pSer/pThr/pTyr-binding forkhead associated (FHA) protein